MPILFSPTVYKIPVCLSLFFISDQRLIKIGATMIGDVIATIFMWMSLVGILRRYLPDFIEARAGFSTFETLLHETRRSLYRAFHTCPRELILCQSDSDRCT